MSLIEHAFAASMHDPTIGRTPELPDLHNGLTVVAKDLKVRGSRIYLNDYSVCNGCQSLLAFWRDRESLRDALEALVRIVRVGDDRGLAEAIAYRTNNQNAISLRDLSSNDSTLLRLKGDFDDRFGCKATYTVQRGENITGPELQNEDAGRFLPGKRLVETPLDYPRTQ